MIEWFKPEKKVVFVNLTSVEIGKEELKAAFAVSENILWWRAIMQTLAVRQQEAVEAAGTKSNEIGMAFELGKAQGMIEVIADLQRLRKMSMQE